MSARAFLAMSMYRLLKNPCSVWPRINRAKKERGLL